MSVRLTGPTVIFPTWRRNPILSTRPRPIRQFQKGQTIIQEGSVGDCSFKILVGEVIICKRNPQGQLIPVAKVGPGEIFGEMYLFENDHIRTASAIAVSDAVSVEVYSQSDISDMLANLSEPTRDIFQGLSQRLKTVSESYTQMAQTAPAQPGVVESGHTFITRKPQSPQ